MTWAVSQPWEAEWRDQWAGSAQWSLLLGLGGSEQDQCHEAETNTGWGLSQRHYL